MAYMHAFFIFLAKWMHWADIVGRKIRDPAALWKRTTTSPGPRLTKRLLNLRVRATNCFNSFTRWLLSLFPVSISKPNLNLSGETLPFGDSISVFCDSMHWMVTGKKRVLPELTPASSSLGTPISFTTIKARCCRPGAQALVNLKPVFL